MISDYVGRRAVTRDVARLLLAERDAEQAARREREQERQRELAYSNVPHLQRVAAIAAQQARMKASGEIDSDAPALAVLAAGDPDSGMETASSRIDELFTAERAGHVGYFHRLDPHQKG